MRIEDWYREIERLEERELRRRLRVEGTGKDKNISGDGAGIKKGENQ